MKRLAEKEMYDTAQMDSVVSVPASAAQTEIFLAQERNPDSPQFNLAHYFEVKAPVDTVVAERALDVVVREADTLRTRFTLTQEYGLALHIDERAQIPLLVVDLKSDENPLDAAADWMCSDIAKVRDLVREPLWTSALLRVGAEHFLWYFRAHHIIVDAFGLDLIEQRVAEVYNELVSGSTLSQRRFGPLGAALQEDVNYRASQSYQRDRDYWLRRLHNRPVPVSLRSEIDRSDPICGSGGVLRHRAYLSASCTRRIRSLKLENNMDTPELLLAALAIYMHRMSGAEDLILGMPVPGRVGALLRATPCMVSNLVPLRVSLHGGMRGADVVTRIATEISRAFRHQRYRIEDLRRDTGAMGSHDRLIGPVINLMRFHQEFRIGEQLATEYTMAIGPVEDLTIAVYDRREDAELRIDFNANSSFYSRTQVEAHQNRLFAILDALVAQPERRISALELLTHDEWHRAVQKWNATDAQYHLEQCIHELFEKQVERSPDAIAVVFDRASMSYGGLNRRANRLAHYLRAQGAGPNCRVALCVERSLEMVVGLLGILKAGSAYVPLDPRHPPERLRYMLRDSAPVAILADTRGRVSLCAGAAGIPVIELQAARDSFGEYPESNSRVLEMAPRSENLAYVIYTSGSTGMPKGVMVTHSAVVNLLSSMRQSVGLQRTDSVLAATTLAFDISVLELCLPLISGARVVVVERATALDPQLLEQAVSRSGVTLMQATPTAWSALLARNWSGSGVKALVGGELLPPALAA
ncbi:MAG TPA: AMP-binding protein, partial [Steroidobacteraceae bacterium]